MNDVNHAMEGQTVYHEGQFWLLAWELDKGHDASNIQSVPQARTVPGVCGRYLGAAGDEATTLCLTPRCSKRTARVAGCWD